MSNDQPAIVKDFSDTADSLDEQAERLERFQDQLQEYSNQVENMNSTEQSAFYDSATSISNRVEDINSVDELLDIEEAIKEAIRSPLERVARESIEEFLSSVSPNLTKKKQERIFEKLSDKLPNELETIGETHQQLIPQINDLPPNLQEMVASQVEDSPSQLLAPHEDIEPLVELLKDRHSLLTEVENAFNEAGEWAPAVEFTQGTEHYTGAAPKWDANDIRDELEQIQSVLNKLPTDEFTLNGFVETELRNTCANMDLSNLTSILRQVRQELSTIADKYNKLDERCTTLENFGTNRGVFEDKIDDLLAQFNQLQFQPHSSLEDLQDSLVGLNTDIETFIDAVATRLKAQQKMVDTLAGDTETNRPGISIGPGDDSIIMPVHVQDNLKAALEDCEAHNEWISATIETGSEEIDQEEMIDIWETLSEGETVPLSDETAEPVLALADELSLGVVLRGG